MSADFTPIIYVKVGCPFCFKLRVFLLEAGLLDTVEVRQFAAGTPEEDAVRAELAPHFEKITFPSAQLVSGEFKNDTDPLIDWFVTKNNVDISVLPTFQAYIEGPFKSIMALYKENRALKENAA